MIISRFVGAPNALAVAQRILPQRNRGGPVIHRLVNFRSSADPTPRGIPRSPTLPPL
jgi:hypothetical protein